MPKVDPCKPRPMSESDIDQNLSIDREVNIMSNIIESWARENMSVEPHSETPAYLEQTYWWAYVRPYAVAFWDRQWLVNLILFGNLARLRDAAVGELATHP